MLFKITRFFLKKEFASYCYTLLCYSLLCIVHSQTAQAEYFYIDNYDINIELQEESAFWVTETIDVVFTQARQGILRQLPYQYRLQALPAGSPKAKRFSEREGYYRTKLDSVTVKGWNFEQYKSGDYITLKIGTKGKYIEGAQRYVIRYKVYGAVNFFDDHSEFYWNLIGSEWDVTIKAASYTIQLPKPLALTETDYFVFTGRTGQKGEKAALYVEESTLSGKLLYPLHQKEGLTVGIRFPQNYLNQDLTPITAFAEAYYIKNQDINIAIQKDGIVEVEEKYVLHLLMQGVPHFYYQMNNLHYGTPPFTTPKLLGGQYEYLIKNISAEGALQHKVSGTEIYFKLSDKKAGQDYPFTIRYQLAGAFLENGKQNGQWDFLHQVGQKWQEPIELAALTLQLPDQTDTKGINFDVSVANEQGKKINELNLLRGGNKITATNKGLLYPGEKVDYELSLPQTAVGSMGFFDHFRLLLKNNYILTLPFLLGGLLSLLWWFFGKDPPFTPMVFYRPPEDLTPAESGILIDDKLHDRDLIAMIPHWAMQGYLTIREIKEKKFILTDTTWEFTKLKNLPTEALKYEHTLFNGIFGSGGAIGKQVRLDSLKDKFHVHMDKAKGELEAQVKKRSFYVPASRGFGVFLMFLGIPALFMGLFLAVPNILEGFRNTENLLEIGIAVLASGLMMLLFGKVMPKKAPLGMTAYKKLYGFRMFVEAAEAPRLEMLLKEDPHYFDKTLAYAIVFDRAEKWASKFKDLSIRPPEPNWYHGSYQSFNVNSFMTSLDKGMKNMGNTFTSQPKSSHSGSGGSGFGGGGGGFSGGGFGGGGGSSW